MEDIQGPGIDQCIPFVPRFWLLLQCCGLVQGILLYLILYDMVLTTMGPLDQQKRGGATSVRNLEASTAWGTLAVCRLRRTLG